MYTASDLRKGLRIKIDNDPYIVTEFNFVKPGKGQALYRCKLKNMVNGNQFERTFRFCQRLLPRCCDQSPEDLPVCRLGGWTGQKMEAMKRADPV